MTVPEDTDTSTLITTLVATDADADRNHSTLLYRPVSGDAFQVDPQTGQVRLARALDFEQHRSSAVAPIPVVVSASDAGGFACHFRIHLVVLDVNDNPPVVDAVQVSAVPEDAPVGSLVGKITASDVDTGRWMFPSTVTNVVY